MRVLAAARHRVARPVATDHAEVLGPAVLTKLYPASSDLCE